MTALIYVNVNEEGVPYGLTTDPEDAYDKLQEFPNDTVVVVTQDSPAAKAFDLALQEDREHWKTYTVEVQPALTYTVNIAAKGPAHAAFLADKESMPSTSEMQVIDGWVFIVEDQETGERLFDSEEGGFPDSLEEALSWDEGGDGSVPV